MEENLQEKNVHKLLSFSSFALLILLKMSNFANAPPCTNPCQITHNYNCCCSTYPFIKSLRDDSRNLLKAQNNEIFV